MGNVTTSDDPILAGAFQEDRDLKVITKFQDKIIFDKRDGCMVDFLTVNETANEPPSNDDKENMNSPMKLGQEASCINQNFSQMVLDPKVKTEEMDQPNPFDEDETGDCASGAYRYKKITLPGNSKSNDEFE